VIELLVYLSIPVSMTLNTIFAIYVLKSLYELDVRLKELEPSDDFYRVEKIHINLEEGQDIDEVVDDLIRSLKKPERLDS